MSRLARLAVLLIAVIAAAPSFAQGGGGRIDPHDVLATAKDASGGGAWDALTTQHSRVTITAAGMTGTAERWAETTTGRSLLRYALGTISGAVGFDGMTAWTQDASGEARTESVATARELAVNAAYRDRLAFWYPERGNAEMEYRGSVEGDGAEFDVVRITPAGGRLFELWVNRQTHLIERMLEREADRTREETYMDFRNVQGVLIPFRVRASRGDPHYDELVVVDAIEYNRPLTGVAFTLPPPPRPDYAFPAGKASVEVPFDVYNGHLFVRVMLDGKGPFRMLFDAGGANVVVPKVAATLGAKPPAGTGGAADDEGRMAVDRVEVGGVVVLHQVFATLDLAEYMHRVEGLDDVAGIVGFEFFRRFPVKLDYARSRAVFYDPARFAYAGGATPVEFRFSETFPLVDGSVDGIPGAFRIDTSNRGSLVLTTPFVDAHDLVARYGATQEFISGAGVDGPVRSLLARAQKLAFGDVEVAAPVAALSRQTTGPFADPALAGNIGYGILRQFNVTFDFGNQRLYFEKNANFGQPDVHERAGLWLERGPTGYAVVDVVAGGPAAQAGLKAGDVVVAVNGKAAGTLSLAQARAALKAAPGSKVALRLAGGAERVVTLRDLI